MSCMTHRICCLVIILAAGFLKTGAQTRSLGASFSFSGAGICYEDVLGEDSFYQLGLKAELVEVFTGRADSPGVSVGFTCNYIIRRWQSENDNEIIFYAGPGIETGWVRDFRSDRGGFVGLKGRIGLQCLFPRKIKVSLSLAPCIGAHFTSKEETGVRMEFYRNGLLSAVMPEIGIRYSF